jgi:hypothetical protein
MSASCKKPLRLFHHSFYNCDFLLSGDIGSGTRSIVIAEFDTWDEAWKYAEQYEKEHPDAMLAVSQEASPQK